MTRRAKRQRHERRLVMASLVALVACGSRTGLLALEEGAPDAAVDASDASDASDAGHDALDAPSDRPADRPLPDVFRNDCPDAASTLIYVVSQTRELWSFDPPAATFRDIGNVNCPTQESAFSMAVDRKGTAFVLFYDPSSTTPIGHLFRVSTANAACTPIPQYVPDQQGFGVFGMGFATNGTGPSEELYVAGAAYFMSTPGLARVDRTSFQLSVVGSNQPPLAGAELTGTGVGSLYAFYFYQQGAQFFVGELDKTTGKLLSETALTGVPTGGSFAVAFWGGDFYFFTGGTNATTVTRYRSSDQSYVTVATLAGATVVGAGVSTCAPQ